MRVKACAGVAPGEDPYFPSSEQQQGRPEVFTDAREWYAQAQAKSLHPGSVNQFFFFFFVCVFSPVCLCVVSYCPYPTAARYLECRGQREVHPRDCLFWIERACLPQSGPIFEMARSQSFFLLEFILLSKAMIAVASPHFFSRGWCLFEFATKLATAPDSNPAALGIAWKAFVSFGSRTELSGAVSFRL